MTKKCIGCGSVLQSNDKNALGYIRESKIDDSLYCENCFKLIHYGKVSDNKREVNYDKLIKDINSKKYPVLYVIDILNLNTENIKFIDSIKNEKYILISKFDVLPKDVKEEKIIKYFKENFINTDNVYCVSAYKNYNIENIFNMLKKSGNKNFFVLGMVNAGKSSLINSFLKLNNKDNSITTSSIPNTTIDEINIDIDGINFIDTQGFKYENSFYNVLLNKEIIKLIPLKRLKVKTFQVKDGDSIEIEDLIRIDYYGNNNSFNFYINDNLNYKKFKSKNKVIDKKYIEYSIDNKKEIFISGLGFIKLNKRGNVKIYSIDNDSISIRDNMI